MARAPGRRAIVEPGSRLDVRVVGAKDSREDSRPSCCSKIIEGKVGLAEQLVLSEDIEPGYSVLRRSKPRSDLVIESDRDPDAER